MNAVKMHTRGVMILLFLGIGTGIAIIPMMGFDSRIDFSS